MTKGWMTIQVELLSGGGITLDPPAGRVMLVGPRHTLKDLAESIDQAFARWDISHLHEFEFPDGRCFGVPDDEWGMSVIDYEPVTVRSVVHSDEPFTYVFDLGDNWRHRCRLTGTDVSAKDAKDPFGHLPSKPVPIRGWGRIPDQYGRRWENDTGEDDTGEDEGSLRLVPKPSKSLTKLQLSLREALVAEPRRDAVVAKALERLLDHPEVEEAHDVPQLLYELANCYTAMGQFDRAIKTIERILARRWIGRPDGRCLIGRVLLTAGRKPEADALYAAIKADGPNDIYLYDTVGTDYAAAGDHESALRWLADGLELAIRTRDPQGLADDLLRCRGESLAALGRDPDRIQKRAGHFLIDAGQNRGWGADKILSPTVALKRRGRARGWFSVRVELEIGESGETVDGPARNKPPGRIFLVGPEHTLKDLAVAIDTAFARWGRPGSREFVFDDGRRFGDPDDELGPIFTAGSEKPPADYAEVKVGSMVRKGEPFVYIPALGAGWRLRCQVEQPDVDPKDEAGVNPTNPIPIWGWGWIPDQDGRRWEGDPGEGGGLPPG